MDEALARFHSIATVLLGESPLRAADEEKLDPNRLRSMLSELAAS